MRKKYLLGAAVTALMLVVAAAAFASSQFKQTVKLNYTTSKTKAPTGLKANLFAKDPGATPPGNQAGASKVTISFVGARVDTSAGKRCKEPKANATQCPKNTQIGSGSALGNVVATTANPPPPTTGLKYKVKAFLKKGGIYMIVDGVGGPFVLAAPFSKHGKLSVNVTRDVVNQPVPQQLQLKPILTDFKLNVKAKSKGKGKHKKTLLRTPKKCGKGGKFKIVTKFVYDDGTKFTGTSKPKCKKPRHRH